MQINPIVKDFFNNPELNGLPRKGEAGRFPVLITGLSGVHRAVLAAGLSEREGAQLVVLCPDDTAAEGMAADIYALTGERAVMLFSRDFTFYPAEAVSRNEEHRRIAALKQLADGAKFAIITAAGLLQRSMTRAALANNTLELRTGESYETEQLKQKLIHMGYSQADQVEGAGQFSQRGGILDVFTPTYAQPVRIEFWGDEIDCMGFFDVSDQRRTENTEHCVVLPASECLVNDYSGGGAALAVKLGALARKLADKGGEDRRAELLAEDAEKLAAGIQPAHADRYAPLIYKERETAADYISEQAVILIDQPSRFGERARDYIKQVTDDVALLTRTGYISGRVQDFAAALDSQLKKFGEERIYMAEAFTVSRLPLRAHESFGVRAIQLPSYGGSAEQAMKDAETHIKNGDRLLILAGDLRRAEILAQMLRERGIAVTVSAEPERLPTEGECIVTVGALSGGINIPSLKLTVMTDTQIRGAGYKRAKKRRKKGAINSYADLAIGDLVVHEHHGVGRFSGVVRMTVDGVERDYIKVLYAGTDSLYVPATMLDLVTKYTGGDTGRVRLSKMGGAEWTKTRTKAKAAAKEMAKELIELYAGRLRQKGHAFSQDSSWQLEFEDSFGYEETDDQLRSIAEIKGDMEKDTPMDRLLCGDVGYGKTEIALRAVMKCITDGKQAAILVPTTVLAEQHYQTAVRRFMGYPVEIRVLSRFKTPKQMAEALQDIKSGRCDLVIGTHRLLQKDIQFKDLGLLVVDEEQRFGVSHKEHIKEMSRLVDVLTLSATPIPRTLNMALSGIRDMSTIEEPPHERLPVQTFVTEHDWVMLAEAMRKELARGGQVYYLHNRVDNIERTALKIRDMLEGVSVGVAHGKMDEAGLSRVMEDMVEGRIDVLVCTSIIETGIDIPNANTLIIEDADRLGLSQLHQLRGRVGRSSRRASAYLTFRQDKSLTEIAEKRLEAIREFAEFNSGFRIAMRDLEIRGAGSLLGAEQSGHMTDVGYDMYMKILEEAVLEERGMPKPKRAECSADLAVKASIPESYVANSGQRMDLYRRIALIRSTEDADEMLDEIIDRFGDPPSQVNSLIQVALLRGAAGAAGINAIKQKGGALVFELYEENFAVERVTQLYAEERYKGRLKVEPGTKPCLSLKIKRGEKVIDIVRGFVADWGNTHINNEAKNENEENER